MPSHFIKSKPVKLWYPRAPQSRIRLLPIDHFRPVQTRVRAHRLRAGSQLLYVPCSEPVDSFATPQCSLCKQVADLDEHQQFEMRFQLQAHTLFAVNILVLDDPYDCSCNHQVRVFIHWHSWSAGFASLWDVLGGADIVIWDVATANWFAEIGPLYNGDLARIKYACDQAWSLNQLGHVPQPTQAQIDHMLILMKLTYL